MVRNAYLLVKIGLDTAENERKFCRNFAKNWPDPVPRGAARRTGGAEGAARPLQRLEVRRRRRTQLPDLLAQSQN